MPSGWPSAPTIAAPVEAVPVAEVEAPVSGIMENMRGTYDDGRRCAWCSGPLPAPDGVLVIVHPSDGEAVSTCSAACAAEWLQQGATGLRSSIRRSMGRGWGS